MSTPSLCGSFLTNKRSLVAFTWTITTVLTLVAFVMAIVMCVQVHTHYRWLARTMQDEYSYNQAQWQGDDDNDRENEHNQQQQQEQQDQLEQYLLLAAMSSKSMTFVAIYTMVLALALSMYGSTAIVGFTSLRGVYIAPCFSASGSPQLRLGMFGGAIVFFANMLMVCAVIFGEVRVEDWADQAREGDNNDQQQQQEPYEVERIATILAVTCMFLSALHVIFALMLFLYLSNGDEGGSEDEDSKNSDPRRENFITMGHDT